MSREIGISKLTVFKLTDANAPVAVYEPGKNVPWVVNVEVSKVMAEYSAFADNVAEISSSKPSSADLTIEVSSDMKPSLEAELTGVGYVNGMMVQGTDDMKPQWGVAYETVMDTGKVRKYFFTNCTISKNEQSNETVSDSITAQTYTLTVKSIPLPITKELFFAMDEDDYQKTYDDLVLANEQAKADAVKKVWDEWFENAPKPVQP